MAFTSDFEYDIFVSYCHLDNAHVEGEKGWVDRFHEHLVAALVPRFGMDVTLSYPEEFMLMPDIVEEAKAQARKFGTGFDIVHDMKEGFKDADVVYAKSWGPLLNTNDPEEGKRFQDQYKNWITDTRKMALAKDDAIYMHPLPADRDIEVTSEVMDGTNSVVFDEAENRLHVQKAVMALTMK